MDNIKNFEDFLDRMQGLLDNAKKQGHIIVRIEDLENAFPELRESEDERIRKAISQCVEDMRGQFEKLYKVHHKDAIAWLDRQGEHINFLSKIQVGDKVTRNKDGVLVNLSQLNRVAKPAEKQCKKLAEKYNITGIKSKHAEGKLGEMIKEMESTDKIEPKFHEGDWVLNNVCFPIQIASTEGDMYVFTDGEAISSSFVDENYHLWSIQDAEDGDVLACESGWTCIFKKLNHNSFGGLLFDSYCFIDRTGWFCDGAEGHTLDERINGKIYPATKEQRDTLFAKMEEFGYEWDAEKKELKKIEQKPWSEEDEKMFEHIIAKATLHFSSINYLDEEEINFLKSLKDRVQPQLKQEWSEEDNIMVHDIDYALRRQITYPKSRLDSMLSWIYNLKDRVQTKQDWSEEDKEKINSVCNIIADKMFVQKQAYKSYYKNLIDFLKSLRPQNKWKPSEEQMEILWCTTERYLESEDKTTRDLNGKILESLYNDLKKLRGE